MKMLKVKENSLKRLGKYLRVDTPIAAWIESWSRPNEVQRDLIDTILVEWDDGKQLQKRNCDRNFYVLINEIDKYYV